MSGKNQLNKYERTELSQKQFKKQFNTYGKYHKLMSDYGRGEPLLAIGPNYIFFLVCFLIINAISIIIIVHLSGAEITKPFYYLMIIVLIILDITWLSSALINPGIAIQESFDEGQMCPSCMEFGRQIVKKSNRVHCDQCQVCIEDQVMHMKLIGGCVGKNNFIAFKLFTLGIFIWSFSLITIIPQFGSLYL